MSVYSAQKMFDSVKYEKEKAMARFNRFRRMKKKLLQVFHVVVVLLLLSWSTNRVPSAVQFSGKLFFELSGFLLNPHVVFLIGNAIILALFLLCKQNGPGDGDDIYDEYAHHSEAPRKSEPPQKPSPPSLEVISVTNDSANPEEKETQMVVAKTEQCEAVEMAIAQAAEKLRRFERTQSQKLKREIGVRPRKELRRSETDNSRSGERVMVRSSFKSFNTVDHLSNEEFKLAVDAFIDKHRESFKEQKMAEFIY